MRQHTPRGTATALEYDGGASPTPATKRELTKMTDESGVVTYGYDSLGRMATKTLVTNGKTFVVTYSWGNSGSAMDKVTAITYPGGSRVNYAYDAKGYMNAIRERDRAQARSTPMRSKALVGVTIARPSKGFGVRPRFLPQPVFFPRAALQMHESAHHVDAHFHRLA